MKIASNGGIPKSSVARADVHCFLFRPCAIPPVCLVDATRPRRARRGPEARAPRENSMCSSKLYRRTSPMQAGGPRPPGKTRCIQAALPENITDAGWRPAHPGRPRGRKMVTGEPDRNLTSPNPPPIRRDSGQDSDCRL